MGSSVSGSLDKYAKVPGLLGTAAAIGSGKVKLPGGPTGGIVGMVQEDMIGSAEAKQAQNAANMQMMQQQQNQQNQYNAALQQMMMGQQQPSPTNFTSLYSPSPYANGGNVTLRRKMFKLGGSASAHGTGLTSGLSFNQGGRVGLQEGGMSISEIAKKFKLDPNKLTFVLMNVEALSHDSGKKWLEEKLSKYGMRSMIIVDESTTIKNLKASRTR